VQTLFDSVENARPEEYKLHRLEHHLTISGRMLNDWHRLCGLLLDGVSDLSQPPAQPLRQDATADEIDTLPTLWA
jgi:hypothetical protein